MATKKAPRRGTGRNRPILSLLRGGGRIVKQIMATVTGKTAFPKIRSVNPSDQSKQIQQRHIFRRFLGTIGIRR